MTGALPSKKLVVAHGRPTANSAKGGMNIQMGFDHWRRRAALVSHPHRMCLGREIF